MKRFIWYPCGEFAPPVAHIVQLTFNLADSTFFWLVFMYSFFLFQYSNNITRDGAKQLALLLKANTPLEILNLAYNRIEDDGAVALAEAVAAYNTNLTTWVSLNFMSRMAVPFFLATLWAPTTLSMPLVFHVVG